MVPEREPHIRHAPTCRERLTHRVFAAVVRQVAHEHSLAARRQRAVRSFTTAAAERARRVGPRDREVAPHQLMTRHLRERRCRARSSLEHNMCIAARPPRVLVSGHPHSNHDATLFERSLCAQINAASCLASVRVVLFKNSPNREQARTCTSSSLASYEMPST